MTGDERGLFGEIAFVTSVINADARDAPLSRFHGDHADTRALSHFRGKIEAIRADLAQSRPGVHGENEYGA